MLPGRRAARAGRAGAAERAPVLRLSLTWTSPSPTLVGGERAEAVNSGNAHGGKSKRAEVKDKTGLDATLGRRRRFEEDDDTAAHQDQNEFYS